MGRIAGFFNLSPSSISQIRIFNEMEVRGEYEAIIYTGDTIHNVHSASEIQFISLNDAMIGFDSLKASSPLSSSSDKFELVGDIDIYNSDEFACEFHCGNVENMSILTRFLQDTFGLEKCSDDEMFQRFDSSLKAIRGVYAIACHIGDKVFLARDLIGVKSLWYDVSSGFAFASEKKFLEMAGLHEVVELDPRHILCYDFENDIIKSYDREFLQGLAEHQGSFVEIRNGFLSLLKEAVSKRVPDEDFGVMFSAGIDSTILALLCKGFAEAKGVKCNYYTVGLSGQVPSPDIACARKLADELELELNVHEIGLDTVEEYLSTVVPLIEDATVPKTGVALTMYAACRAAKEDGINVLFAGAGADELFAGYNRFKSSESVNEDCIRDIMEMHKVNTYRDDTVAAFTGTIVRYPYLDENFVEYALAIPKEYKISDEMNKIVLRKAGEELGLPKYVVERGKKAAQYGSSFDQALKKLAKRAGFANKTDYINSFQERR
ncbi:asparagine synthetase B family protein [Methanococcoides burtonii]|nr:asparagine synthetase B [Methanococcoides burtonii]